MNIIKLQLNAIVVLLTTDGSLCL